MKRTMLSAAILLPLIIIMSCKQATTLQIKNKYADLDEQKEAVIINDIEKSLQNLIDGIEQSDAKKIFSIYSKKANTTYVRDGHIYASVDEAEKQYSEWLKDSSDEKRFTFLNRNYDILNEGIVLFTGVGVIETLNSDEKPWEIAYTILWIAEEDAWKALNMHISWE